MRKTLSFALAVTLIFAVRDARAQPGAENTPEACSDRMDNDGDGYVDCMDQDCQRLPICQAPPQGAAQPPPPPPGDPPQPQYPPPGYYTPGRVHAPGNT